MNKQILTYLIQQVLNYVNDNLNELPEKKNKAKQILKSVRKYKRKELHWTQKPENRARLKKILKDAAKKRLNSK